MISDAVAPPTSPADSLVIAGLVPLSTLDWPDHLVATLFLQGCPWNCFYCHNRALIPTRVPGAVAWEDVRHLLSRRRGLLDGVVFTGGEALRQDALADAAREVRNAGFAVGLHTAGCYPRRLADLVSQRLVDWVGLDLKALPEHYADVIGPAGCVGGTKAWECLDLLVAAQAAGWEGSFEVRTTVVPADVTVQDAYAVAQRAHAGGARHFALQQARSQGSTGDFPVTAPGWEAECERLATRISDLGWESFSFRQA